MSLRIKFLAGIAGLVILLGTAVIILVQTSVTERLSSELLKRGLLLAQDISDESADYVLSEDMLQLQMLLMEHIERDDEIKYLIIHRHDGEVLAHTFEQGIPPTLKYRNYLSPGQAYSIRHLITEKEPVVDIAVPILKGEAGTVRVGILEQYIKEDITNITRLIIFIVIAFLILGGGAIILFTATITKPLFNLKKSAEMIGSGDLSHIVDVKAKDEIGNVAAAFNKMTANLLNAREQIRREHIEIEKAHSELSALHNISSSVSRTINMDELITRIFDAITGLDMFATIHKGGVFIVEGDKMTPAAYFGHSEDFMDIHRDMKVGDCLCGLAAKTGEVLILKNCAKDSRHTKRYDRITPHGHIIIPLKVRDTVVGVLSLYVITDIEGIEQRLSFFNSLGNQIGMAIDNARLYEETKSLSLHDSLTGLANRRYMDIIFERYFNEAQRFGNSLSVCMLDIDFFKNYNDKHGHIAGDKLLMETAQIILEEIRNIDFAVRYGGEEFFIILQKTVPAKAYEVAERIKKAIEGKEEITVSIGIASYNKDMQSKEELLENSDKALYKAKQKGRNRIEACV